MFRKTIYLVLSALGISGCAGSELLPTRLAENVDIQRYMGSWYVIAQIPTFMEVGAHNAVETYSLAADGTIPTVFTCNKDGFNGPRKVIKSTAYTTDNSAVLKVQFWWPFKADYRIMYLTPDYSQVIVGRNQRDYVWIMARTPQIPTADLEKMKQIVAEEGYDMRKLILVPQELR